MVVVEAVLDQQVPVGANRVFLRAADDLHLSARRLVDHEVEVLLRAGEVVRERYGIWIERDEHEAAVRGHMRRLRESQLGTIEAGGIARFAGHAVELTVAIVAPAVIEALVAARIARALAAHRGAPVPAHVQEHADLRGAVAAQDDGPPAHRARHEIARRRDLALVAGVDPAHVEDAPHLAFQHRGIDHRCAMHAEVEPVGIVVDVRAVAHGGYDNGMNHALLAFFASLAAIVVPSSHAQPAYPSRTVTIVVPYTPGTGADVIARLL